MLDEEKIKKAFKVISYNLDKLRKKLNELEKKVDNLFKLGEN